MSKNTPIFVNRWFLLFFGLSVLCFLILLLFGTGNNSSAAIRSSLLIIGSGFALLISGAIWLKLYFEEPSGTYCFHCGYDMQAQENAKPTCPECGSNCLSEYPKQRFRETAKQGLGCLIFLLGCALAFIGFFDIRMVHDGLFSV